MDVTKIQQHTIKYHSYDELQLPLIEIPIIEKSSIGTLFSSKFFDTQNKTRKSIVNYLVKLIF